MSWFRPQARPHRLAGGMDLGTYVSGGRASAV
jgi:hypothetical protein